MSSSFHITTPRLVLRSPRPSDAEALAIAADDPRIARDLRDRFPSPYTVDDARRFIASAARVDTHERLVLTVDDTVIGGLGITRGQDVARRSAEIGYWLGVAHWGNGYMNEAVAAACDDVFATTDIVRIHGLVFAGNPASVRVLEKCGFVREGVARRAVYKGGEFRDAHVYALLSSAVAS